MSLIFSPAPPSASANTLPGVYKEFSTVATSQGVGFPLVPAGKIWVPQSCSGLININGVNNVEAVILFSSGTLGFQTHELVFDFVMAPGFNGLMSSAIGNGQGKITSEVSTSLPSAVLNAGSEVFIDLRNSQVGDTVLGTLTVLEFDA